MQNDENTNDVEVETKDNEAETVEETVAEDAKEESQGDTTEDNSEADELAKARAEAAKYRRLFEKGNKPQVAKPKATTKASAQPSVEEAVLLANGMSEELVESLKKVAAVEGIGSLIKAQSNPIFIAVKEKFEREQKQKAASLGASRGSGSVKAKKDFNSPNLTREEHQKMVQDSLS